MVSQVEARFLRGIRTGAPSGCFRAGAEIGDKGADFYARTAVELSKTKAPKLCEDCFKDAAAVPFVPTPKPKGLDEAYEKLLKEESAKLADGKSDKFYSFSYDEPMEIGNYDVTVNLGTGKGPCASYVKFVGRRLAVDRTETKAGETKAVTFTARVPGPYTTRRSNEQYNRRLLLEMFCNAPQEDVPVFEPLVVPAPDSRTIYLCGDSTVTDQRNEPWGSWGQILPAFVKKGWAVSNFARSGLALKTFEGEGRLKRIFEHLKKDDWVVIQFGHNDQKIEGEEPSLANVQWSSLCPSCPKVSSSTLRQACSLERSRRRATTTLSLPRRAPQARPSASLPLRSATRSRLRRRWARTAGTALPTR